MNWPSALRGFLVWARQQGRSRHTIKAYTAYAKVFEEYLTGRGVDDLQAVDESLVADFQGHLMAVHSRSGRPYTGGTRGLILSWLRKFFWYLQEGGRLLVDPTRQVRLPRRGRRLPRAVLTAAQMRRLLAVPETRTEWGLRDRAILELMYGVGLRFSELADLRVGDVDLEEKAVWVRRGKGRKDRLLPLGRAASGWLRRYLQASDELRREQGTDRVFLTPRGRRLHNATWNEQLRVLVRRAKIDKPVTAHALRHTFATVMIRGGADLRHIQRLLGHGSLAPTALYTHLDLRDLRRAQSLYHPREKKHGGRGRGRLKGR